MLLWMRCEGTLGGEIFSACSGICIQTQLDIDILMHKDG